MRYADLHCDALSAGPPRAFLRGKKTAVSFDKLVGGGCFLQCFAIFTPDGDPRAAREMLAAYRRERAGLEAAGVTPVLTVENGGIFARDGKLLDELRRAGLKMSGFTWNGENELGFPCGAAGGLKYPGRRLAEALFARGIYADVSHLSDGGFDDLAAIAACFRVSLVASHSLARAVCPHPRNLTDGQIREIARSGGLVGVNFVREFIGEKGIFAHIRHILNVGGEEILAIGTDFDGTENPLYAGADEMPRFFDDLAAAGIPFSVAEKLAFRNAERLFL